MLLLPLSAAIVALAAIVAATTFAFVRTRELLRQFRAFGEATGDALAAVEASGNRLAARTAAAEQRAAALEPALDRLTVSRAKLSVLLAAVDDLRAATSRVTQLRPRK